MASASRMGIVVIMIVIGVFVLDSRGCGPYIMVIVAKKFRAIGIQIRMRVGRHLATRVRGHDCYDDSADDKTG